MGAIKSNTQTNPRTHDAPSLSPGVCVRVHCCDRTQAEVAALRSELMARDAAAPVAAAAVATQSSNIRVSYIKHFYVPQAHAAVLAWPASGPAAVAAAGTSNVKVPRLPAVYDGGCAFPRLPVVLLITST